MVNNTSEHVEENKTKILESVGVENGRGNVVCLLCRQVEVGDIVLGRDERRRERRRRLEHESDDEDHAHTRDNVGMILNDKFVAQIGH